MIGSKAMIGGAVATVVVGALLLGWGWEWRGGSQSATEPAPLVQNLPPPSAAGDEEDLELEDPTARRVAAAEGVAASPAELFATLRGRCIDARGLPVEGARVRSSVRGVETASALDGRFELTLSVPASGVRIERVLIDLEGYARLQRELRLASGVQELGDFLLEAAGGVAGRVVDGRGNPVAGARVAALDGPWYRSSFGPHSDVIRAETASDAAGSFSLAGVPLGQRLLVAGAAGFQWHAGLQVEVQAGAWQSGIELMLEPAPDDLVVELIVLDPAGRPVPRARIAYRSASGNGSSSADERGIFRRELHRRTPHDFSAVDRQGRWRPATLQGVLPGQKGLELRLGEPLDLALTVLDGEARPVEVFRAYVRTRTLEAPMVSETRDPAGRAELRVPGETFRVVVVAPGHEILELGPFDPDAAPAELTARLRSLPGWRGTVRGPDGPLAGARVMLLRSMAHANFHVDMFPARSTSHATETALTDEEGRFRFTGREAGTWFVRAEAEGLAAAELGPLELRPELGRDDLDVALPLAGILEGRVLLADGAPTHDLIVGVSRGDGFARTARPDPEGRFRFEGLMPGLWLVERVPWDILPGDYTGSVASGRPVGELPWSCAVSSGQVTHFDLDLRGPAVALVIGRLRIDGEPARGWNVGPGGVHFGSKPGSKPVDLDAEGRFTLEDRRPRPGCELVFIRRADTPEVLVLHQRVELSHGSNSVDLDIRTGRLEGALGPLSSAPQGRVRIEGSSGEDLSFELFLRTAGETRYSVQVPSGRARVELLEESAWRELGTVEIGAGRTTTFALP